MTLSRVTSNILKIVCHLRFRIPYPGFTWNQEEAVNEIMVFIARVKSGNFGHQVNSDSGNPDETAPHGAPH